MKQWRINKEGVTLVEKAGVREEGQVKVKISKVAVSSADLSHLATCDKDSAIVPGHSAVAYVSEADEDSGLSSARAWLSARTSLKKNTVLTW